MIFPFLHHKKPFNNLQESRLFDETNFYKQFTLDLLSAEHEVLIESPFITSTRMELLMPIFKKLLLQKIKVIIITRHPSEHTEEFIYQTTEEILQCSELGIQFTFVKNHHRKLAIIDKTVLWEGSLNILSQTKSKEIMRRIVDRKLSDEMYSFLKLDGIT